MSRRRRVLVTGPIGRAEAYADAARAAGFDALVCELLVIRPRALDGAVLPATVDLVCATSKHALHALANVPRVPAAAVGEETAERLRELGFALALPAARDAAELALALAAHLGSHRPPATVFWPRGALSDALARDLRARGIAVVDPIVYETVAVPDVVLPEVELVFLASPSAVRAFAALAPGGTGAGAPIGIAVGATTTAAMRGADARFAAILTLERPAPDALARVLRQLGSTNDP